MREQFKFSRCVVPVCLPASESAWLYYCDGHCQGSSFVVQNKLQITAEPCSLKYPGIVHY